MINADDELTLAYLIDPTFEITNTEGRPLTGGYIEVYLHGTRSKYYCYSDWNGSLHPFKIPLDSLGANIILASPAHSYDIYVYNKYGSLVMSRYNVVPATGDGTVVKDVVTISSDDNSVSISSTDQTNWNLSIKDTIDRVEQNEQDISDIEDDISGLDDRVDVIEDTLPNKKDKQASLEFTGSATKTIKSITQNANGEMNVEFEDIDLPQEVPNVNVTSSNSSVEVTTTIDPISNTKTFDLSVANDTAEVEYGRFIASNITNNTPTTLIKTRGNLELANNKIQLKGGSLYHFTLRGSYQATTLSNTLSQVSFIEYSTFNSIMVNVDNSISDTQFFELSFDVVANNDIAYPVTFTMPNDAKVSSLEIDVHSVVASSGSGGSGDPINVAHDGTMTGDGTDEMPLSIQSSLDVSNANTAPKYDPSATYPTIGTLCTYNNVLYRSKVAINEAEEWNEEHWEVANVASELSNTITNLGTWEDITSKFTRTSLITSINGMSIRINRAIGLLYFNFDMLGDYSRTSSQVKQQLFKKNSSDISTLKFNPIFGLFIRRGSNNKEVPYQVECRADGIYGWLPDDGVNAWYILVSGIVPFTI